MSSSRAFIGWLVALLIVAASGSALAQEAPAPTSPAPPAVTAAPPPPADPGTAVASEVEDEQPAAPTAEDKQSAKQHFLKGISLLRQQAWAPALAEFLLSRELYGTRVATNNAAIALRKLERYDEALAMLETMLRDFKVNDEQRSDAQRQIAELRSLVGTIDISGAEPGASIVISSIDRGEYPPLQPIRVPAGNHVVRIFKEGFESFETRVDVAGGQLVSVRARMAQLKESGKLRVTEQSGKKVDVLVDNVVVGTTPWDGTLAVGDHTVMLRGTGKLGTQPASAPVKNGELTNLTLLAEDLDATLRVEPTPPGASVWVNSVNVGRGVWLGRLKVDAHKLEVKADGFLSDVRTVKLERGQRETLKVSLERDEDAPHWRKPSKWTMDFSASFVVAPTFGGDVAGGCEGDCTLSTGIGGLALVHAGYELGSGFGFGLEAGYLIAAQDIEDRASSINPNGVEQSTSGVSDHSLRLQGFVGGATIGYHIGSQFPVLLRLGAGVVVGEVRDERSGSYLARDESSYDAYPVVSFPSATYIYLDPGVRAGILLADDLELSANVQALMLIAVNQPKWNDSLEVAAATDGIATYPDETLLGSFVVMVAPGANLRYTF